MKLVHEEASGKTMVEIDPEFLAEIGARPDLGGVAWTNDQLVVLGVEVPPRSGWRQRLYGTLISKAEAKALQTLGERYRSRRARPRPAARWADQALANWKD